MTLAASRTSMFEFVRKQAAAHARRLGAAKGRARQAENRAAKAAQVADLDVRRERAQRAVSQIEKEIKEVEEAVVHLRRAVNNPAGGPRAHQANKEMLCRLRRRKELQAELEHFQEVLDNAR